MADRPLLLIGAGKMGAGYLTAAQRAGATVRVVEFAPFVARSRALAERVVEVGSMAEESWYSDALAVLDGVPPSGVVAFSEPQVLAGALVQDAFGLPGPGLHAAVVSRNKALQRALFGRAGIAQPPYQLATDLAGASDWASAHFPLVIKPLSEYGSIGVELVTDERGFADAISRRGAGGKVLLEVAVDGPEFSAESLVREGEVLFTNITAKQTTGPPRFIEVCHRPGIRFDRTEEADAVNRFVATVISALRMRTGIVHVEFRLDPARAFEPVLMEVAVRTPGDFIMDVVGLTWGFDLFGAVVALALGGTPAVPAPGANPVASAASRFLFAEPGVLREVVGLATVQAHPHVVRCVVNYELGAHVRPARSSLDRAGHAIISAPDPRARDAALDFLDGQLQLLTEPTP